MESSAQSVASEEGQVYEMSSLEVEFLQLKEMVRQQSARMEAFMKAQESVNQRLLDAKENPRPRNLSTEAIASTSSGEFVPSNPTYPMPNILPNPEPNANPLPKTNVVDSEWKEVARSLARRSAGPIAEKPLFIPGKTNPVLFLEQFEKYFRMTRFAPEDKLDVMRGCLGYRVAQWVDANEKEWVSFEAFRREFLERFWSEKEQRAERMRVLTKRFVAGAGGSSMSEYFLKQMSLLRTVSPLVPEAKLVEDIMDQLPDSIQALWSLTTHTDMKTTVRFITKQEAIGRKRKHLVPESTSGSATRRPRLEQSTSWQREREEAVPPYLGSSTRRPQSLMNPRRPSTENFHGER
ncbi:hypothetical protein PPYR_02920 [Photinus pyralis]|uniref:Retrotransposon gag domain-containing protein n=1 Tax=Photinus pyralis TaxID=7054 RepID=A0A5N4A1C0_PHOPY|nr:uncharacterized protein LOC116162264 [Photinus pyralis]XP_031331710.1 uncharacterized protein LOC116162264 [Photinus pyralis]XP_031331711.1 uncharacterized protein LOC116162264 [Photinus pyralis]XP_031331712.1 uncharacterized protein LOC116162264 [Photinus pyralis]XP_031331713.1 uncharacterized protein LOC116162264 [Photinus pyralis]KAB0791120.1 hypothetical protein PPYR_02920 [Photinus pyralis]